MKKSDNKNKKYQNDPRTRANHKGNRPDRTRSSSGQGPKSEQAVPNNSLSSLNDIAWYSKNPELLAAAARIPFPYRPNMVVPNYIGSITGYNGAKSSDLRIRVPGVMVIDFDYTIGYSNSIMSAASIAAKEIYGRIRRAYSGALEADAPDIMMYCLALDQIHAYIAYLKRLYRCLTTFDSQNRDFPYVILRAMGISHTDYPGMIKEKVTLWSGINTLVHMVNKFSVPDDMDIYKRHRWMNENIYLDAPQKLSQSYIFMPTGFYSVDETGANGTRLVWGQLSPLTKKSVSLLIDYGMNMIKALSDWDDAYTINGYFERAFEGTNFYHADLLGQDETIIPVYVPEVLSQIENLRCFGVSNHAVIDQDPSTNAIIHTPAVSTLTDFASKANAIMNLHTENPSAADVTIASRLMLGRASDTLVCGTEIPTQMHIYYARPSDETAFDDYTFTSVQNYPTSNTTVSQAFQSFGSIFAKMWFTHSPLVTFGIYSPSDETAYSWILGELENVTSISSASLAEIHRVCTYSEFNCFR